MHHLCSASALGQGYQQCTHFPDEEIMAYTTEFQQNDMGAGPQGVHKHREAGARYWLLLWVAGELPPQGGLTRIAFSFRAIS